MEAERIGDMTMNELKEVVESIVDAKIQRTPYTIIPKRPIKEVLESMWANMIELKPGQPSTLEMLREDRDR